MVLEWQKKPSDVLMTWDEANLYVKSLGHKWRLPSKIELMHAYHDKIEGFHSNNYWSSYLHSKIKNYHNSMTGSYEHEIPCYVNFQFGYYNFKFKNHKYLVRAVTQLEW